MALCDIAAGVLADQDGCNLNLKVGVEDKLYLFNFSEKGSITKNVSNPILLDDLQLAVGANAYLFEGLNGSIVPASNLVPKTYQKTQQHVVNFLVFSHEPEDEKVVNDLMNATVCAIVKTKTGHWKVYGYNTGLIVTEGGNNHGDTDLNGAWSLNLTSKEGNEEGEIPYTLLDTDEATTDALVEALLAA